MRRRSLHAAVAKLEAKMRPRRAIRPVIFAPDDDEGTGDIIGLSKLGGPRVDRLFGEDSLTAFAHRAAALLCRPGMLPIMCGHRAEPDPALVPDGAAVPPVAPITTTQLHPI